MFSVRVVSVAATSLDYVVARPVRVKGKQEQTSMLSQRAHQRRPPTPWPSG